MQYIHPRIFRYFRVHYPVIRYTLVPVVLTGLLTASAMAALTVVADLGGESTVP
ncbi:integrating conjugative element protein, partial [Salmonella enterica subsp. enterica serovar Muenchen]|nr:integrating conjugative element protein [Salmonella enterica subsp. enterica serovar Muenchen]